MPALFELLASALGGDSTTETAPVFNPKTYEIVSPGSVSAKHPFLSKMSGKADEIAKMNHLMKMLQVQQKIDIGNKRLTHSQEIDKMGQIQNIDLLTKTGQPFNPQTTKGLNETAYDPELLKLVQGALAEKHKADSAISGATRQKADLEKRVASQRFLDTYRNPNKTVEQDDRSFEANLLKVIGEGTLGISPTGEKGGFSLAARGNWDEEQPIMQKYGDKIYDSGKSRTLTHQGGVFVSPERLKAVKMGSTGLNPNLNLSGNPAAQVAPVLPTPVVAPTEHRLDPASLGINPSARPTNYQMNPGWGSILKDAGLTKDLMKRLGILAN